MSRYISQELRQLVISRAKQRCEYCLIREDDTFFGCEIDHIISVKHGGTNIENNLALACFICNRQKGSDIGTVIETSREFVRFFNPRVDQWEEQFFLEHATIKPKTEIGKATVKICDSTSQIAFWSVRL